MAKVGLVTVLFNCDDVLPDFFKSLSIQTFKDYHLYIIDNTPSETTDKVLFSLASQYPTVTFTHSKSLTNVGIAKGNNIGIEAALNNNSEYVLLLNNDIEFEQVDLLKGMIELADKRKEALVIPKIFFYGTKKIWMAGGHFQWWKAMALHVGEQEEDNEKFDTEYYCNYAPTCFMLISSLVFKKIGLMDERYFVYFDDTDFAYRAVEAGYRIRYCPQFSLLHKVGSSTGGYDSPFSIYYGNRNRMYFIRKHYSISKKIISFFYFFTTRILKFIKYNKEQRRELLKAINAGFAMKKTVV